MCLFVRGSTNSPLQAFRAISKKSNLLLYIASYFRALHRGADLEIIKGGVNKAKSCVLRVLYPKIIMFVIKFPSELTGQKLTCTRNNFETVKR